MVTYKMFIRSLTAILSCLRYQSIGIGASMRSAPCFIPWWWRITNKKNMMRQKKPRWSSSDVVVRSTGACVRLSDNPTGPEFGWVKTWFLNTTPIRLFDLDSEIRSRGSPSSFGSDVKLRSLLPSTLCWESKRHRPGGKGVTCVWTLILG